MSGLQQFLNNNPIDNVTEEVAVSKRFKDAEGSPLKFTIKAMTSREFADIQKRSTEVKKGGKVDFDSRKFNMAVAINHTLVPDFKDAESLKQMGCSTPEDYLNRVLLAGEIAELVSQINKLSGFDLEMSDLVEEAKN